MLNYALVTEKEAKDPTSARRACYPVLSCEEEGNRLIDKSGILTFKLVAQPCGYNLYRADVNVNPLGTKDTFPLGYRDERNLDFLVLQNNQGIIDLVGDRKGYALMQVGEVEAQRLIDKTKSVQGTWLSAV